MQDTLSRENNNYLPVAGIGIGILACILAIAALVKVGNVNKKIPEGLSDSVAKIDVIDGQSRSAMSTAEQAKSSINTLGRQTNEAFQAAAAQIQEVRGEIEKIKEASKAKAPAPGAKGAAKGPVTAGPDEYIVKAGDTCGKIAKAHGVSPADVQAVNPGVNWTKLKVGDKLKLPQKK